MVLTASQQAQLATTGVARIPGVVDGATCARLADAVWASLASRGVDRTDPSTWPVGFSGKNQGLRKARVFDAFRTPATSAIVDQLLGRETWENDQSWGPALVTFPEPGPWTVPHKSWHLDLPGRGDPDRPHAVRLFGYISDVVARGGGTLVVEGSHELVRRMAVPLATTPAARPSCASDWSPLIPGSRPCATKATLTTTATTAAIAWASS